MFDLDGTLLDSVPDLAAAVDIMLTQLERPVAGEAKVRLWVGNGLQKLVERALADDLNPSHVEPELVSKAMLMFSTAYAEQSSRTKAFSGVLAALQQLAKLAIPLALITNKPQQFLPKLLTEHALQDYFSWVIGGDTLPVRKPDPGALLWVMQQAKVEPQQSVFIGDSRNDVLAARAAKVSCVAMSYGYNHGRSIAEENPDLLIDNLLELFQS